MKFYNLSLYFLAFFLYASAYQHETLSEWTIDCFKNLEEPDFGKFKTQLTAHDLKLAIKNFINCYKTDKKGFLNKSKWVKPNSSPTDNSALFDLKNKNEYVHPYVQKLVISKTYPDKTLLKKLKAAIPEKKRYKAKICVIGDIHGSLHSLLRNLWRLVVKGYLDDDFTISRPNFYIIFTGDYVDRGGYSPDVIYTILRLKLKNPNNVFLLRGNHEDMTFNKNDPKYLPSIWLELNKKYAFQIDKLEPLFCRLYDLMPHAVYLVCDNAVVKFCHGGIEPLYNSANLISNSDKIYEKLDPADAKSKIVSQADVKRLLTSLHKSKFGAMLADTDFVHVGFNWCDFAPNLKKKDHIRIIEGRGYRARMGLADLFMKDKNLKAIFRGHQHYAFGLKLYKKSEGSTQNGDHWSDVVSKKEQINKDGFAIENKNFFPIFTLSTAAASSTVGEKINLPYDCLALITVGETWNSWRLKPYEFEHKKRILFNLDKSYLSIEQNKEPSLENDLLKIDYSQKPAEKPVGNKLLLKAETNTSNMLISEVRMYQTLNPKIKASDIYNILIQHLHDVAGWN